MAQAYILLVGKSLLLRQGLKHVLNSEILSVVGEESSLTEALNFVQLSDRHVDLIIYDQEEGSGEGLTDLKAIVDAYPQIAIVILTGRLSAPSLEKALEAGARGLLPNTISPQALNLVLQLLLLGENLFTAAGEVAGELGSLSREAVGGGDDCSVRLSPREDAILNLLGAGEPNKVIARRLNIAEATVKVHVKSVLRKIDVGNRTQAAVWAINHPAARRLVTS